ANERHLELRRGDVREALLAAGGSLLERLPLSVPVMVGQQHLAAGADGREELVSPDPGKPRREVARAAMASGRDVDAAVRLAPGGHAEWAARSPQQRAETLIAAACLLRERRLELAALAVYECAKPWLEAGAGVPAAALALLPGDGRAGEALVRHPGVHAIAFTGSCEVGLQIVRAAAETPPAQRHLKRVVAEMGGKNCVIVDSDADLDQAVPAIVRSAYGYAGQKCSAAARVLAHEAIAAQLIERLAGAVRALRVGQADELGIVLGPLIDADAQGRVQAYIEAGSEEGRVRAQVALPAGASQGGFFVRPTLLSDLPAGSRLLREEVFGPVLTVEAVRDVASACDVVDGLRFGLTGGLFSRNPATIGVVRARTQLGYLYLNREITGAMVGRQPFGGNRLSGTGG